MTTVLLKARGGQFYREAAPVLPGVPVGAEEPDALGGGLDAERPGARLI